jgi:hypothetical protein
VMERGSIQRQYEDCAGGEQIEPLYAAGRR